MNDGRSVTNDDDLLSNGASGKWQVASGGEGPATVGQLSIGQCACLACLLEVSAPKAGNVHRGADFADLRFTDFLASAAAIAPSMDSACHAPLGTTILQAVRATRSLVATNSNLGTILLLAPLAAVPRDTDLSDGVADVLARLTRADAGRAYEAIRLAQPGGLGRVSKADIAGDAPDDLIAAMRAAAERDLVARQYANAFYDVIKVVAPWLREGQERGWTLTYSIVHTQMRLMCEYPDSLIARKCGESVARQAAAMADHVLRIGLPGDPSYLQALSDFDFWLRADHNRRNPGTTADMIAAGLFVLLRDGAIKPPYH